jgi:hypothetical protein
MLLDEIKKAGKENEYILGALGDLNGCALHREKEELTDTGWETKYFGIKDTFHGKIDNQIIDRANITKRAFNEILRTFWLSILLMLPFSRNLILYRLINIYRVEGGLKSVEFKLKEFCPACRELVRAGLRISERVKGRYKEFNLENIYSDFVYCVGMFLQFSTTYRFLVQDILGDLNKDSFIKSPLTETLRLKRIFIFRLKDESKQMKLLWWAIFFGVMFNKKIAIDFIKNLDLEKVKLDKSDWYYGLRRKIYDFGGKSLYSRLVEAEQIDREQGNIIL